MEREKEAVFVSFPRGSCNIVSSTSTIGPHFPCWIGVRINCDSRNNYSQRSRVLTRYFCSSEQKTPVYDNGRVGWYPQTQDERKECIRRVNGNCENKGWKGFPFPPRGKIQNAVVLFILVHISCFLPGWKPLSCLPPVHFKQDDSRSLSSPPLRFFITIYSRAPLERAVAPIFCG